MNELPIRVPLSVIGGFLGAGKTTLINRLLRDANGRRMVVFVNDFGALNIDVDLIETRQSDRISLKNGCVCCTLNQDLVRGIATELRAIDTTPPDALLIETSGIADPRALDSSLHALELAGLIRIDAKLYVLDADRFASYPYDEAETVIDHAAASDLVLLNKVDLARASALTHLHATLAEAAPYTRVAETTYCDLPIDCIVTPQSHIEAFKPTRVIDHTQRYLSWTHETSVPLSRARFDAFVAQLPRSVMRAKGILFFEESPNLPMVFHLVGHRVSITPFALQSSATVPSMSRIVVIGTKNGWSAAQMEAAAAQLQSDGSTQPRHP